MVKVKSLLGAASSFCDVVSVVGQCMQVCNDATNLQLRADEFKQKANDITNFMNTGLDKLFNNLKDMSGNFSQAGNRAALDFSRYKVNAQSMK